LHGKPAWLTGDDGEETGEESKRKGWKVVDCLSDKVVEAKVDFDS
jgi:hypothetical protein